MRALIRADGDSSIGAGHVMRMLALADSLHRMGSGACLVSTNLDPSLERRAATQGVAVEHIDALAGSDEDARWVAARASEGNFEWIVLDGYGFGSDFQDQVGRSQIPVLAVDDFGHNERYSAQLVLNANLSAGPELYRRRSAHTRLLLGPQFALLRPEFSRARPKEPETVERVRRILVTMGGGDPVGASAKIVEFLEKLLDDFVAIRVVVGPSNPDFSRLEELARGTRLEVVRDVGDMAGTMRWADLAISAAGTTSLELCCMGVPTLLVVIADNQLEGARSLARADVCANLGWIHSLTAEALVKSVSELCGAPGRRQTMAESGHALVDGGGGARVVEAMHDYADGSIR